MVSDGFMIHGLALVEENIDKNQSSTLFFQYN